MDRNAGEDEKMSIVSSQLIWLGIFLAIIFGILMILPFPTSLVVNIGVVILLNMYRRKTIMKRIGIGAKKFAEFNKMFAIAGSDSHISSTLGRCINTIESENNLDSNIDNLYKGRSKIRVTNYATKKEIYEHLYFILTSSSESLMDYVSEYHPRVYHVVKWALASFSTNPNSALWYTLGSLSLYLTKRISKKVNIGGSSPEIFQGVWSWKRLNSLAIVT